MKEVMLPRAHKVADGQVTENYCDRGTDKSIVDMQKPEGFATVLLGLEK